MTLKTFLCNVDRNKTHDELNQANELKKSFHLRVLHQRQQGHCKETGNCADREEVLYPPNLLTNFRARYVKKFSLPRDKMSRDYDVIA